MHSGEKRPSMEQWENATVSKRSSIWINFGSIIVLTENRTGIILLNWIWCFTLFSCFFRTCLRENCLKPLEVLLVSGCQFLRIKTKVYIIFFSDSMFYTKKTFLRTKVFVLGLFRYLLTSLPDGQIKLSICPRHFEDPYFRFKTCYPAEI